MRGIMTFRRSALVSLLLLVFVGTSQAAGTGWRELRMGMSAEQASAVIGEPLIRSSSRGFEVWIYDGRGEVVFYAGPVIAWTVPIPLDASIRPAAHDVWFKPARRPVTPLRRPFDAQRGMYGDGRGVLSTYRYRSGR